MMPEHLLRRQEWILRKITTVRACLFTTYGAALAAGPTINRSGSASLFGGLRDLTPAILFALRFWLSVCLSFYVGFALQFENPTWAATTAIVICQPVLGASLRKASFRMIGSAVGASGIVILAALFRQDRVGFLVGLALWCAASAFVATLLRNFAAYAAALSGFTAAILASDILGPVGTSGDSVTILAVHRTAEICTGIVCACVVLALTDLGHSRRKLEAEFVALSMAAMDGLADCFVISTSALDEFQARRRDLLRRVIALDPTIDAAIGEVSDIRYRSPALQRAVWGFFETISAWRKAAFEMAHRDNAVGGREARAIHDELPHDRLRPDASGSAKKPAELREACCAAARSLTRFNAETPSQRLLADSAAAGMLGMARVLNGLTGVVSPSEMIPMKGTAQLHVPDWLPPSINALRAFLAVGATSLFWIASAWPSGTLAIMFCAVIVILLPVMQRDLAYSASMTFLKGSVLGAGVAAILAFGILPRVTNFPTLCLALGLALVPFGFLLMRGPKPLFFLAASFTLLPLLSITNDATYDASQFWNGDTAILAGVAFGAVALLILPPLSPAIRTSRLLALTLADLRRLAKRPSSIKRENDWESRCVARLLAMPEQAEPVERAELVAAIDVGREIVRLRGIAPRFVPGVAVDAALQALAEGRSGEAIERLKDIDHLFAARSSAESARGIQLRLRASVLAISGQLAEYGSYFDERLF